MTFDYDFCCVSMQKLKYCMICWYRSVLSVKTYIAGYSDHSAVVCIIYQALKIREITGDQLIVVS